MNDLIAELTKSLGIDEDAATKATGAAMALLRENVGEDLFGKIGQAVPDAASMADQAQQAPAAEPQEGGLLGALAGMASSALGGKAGSGLELSAALGESGLPLDKIGPFLNTLIGFLKQYLGEDVVAQILDKFPMLKAILDQDS